MEKLEYAKVLKVVKGIFYDKESGTPHVISNAICSKFAIQQIDPEEDTPNDKAFQAGYAAGIKFKPKVDEKEIEEIIRHNIEGKCTCNEGNGIICGGCFTRKELAKVICEHIRGKI